MMKHKKIILVGTGFVGMSYAYALLNQGVGDELVLLDVDFQKAQAEALDLNDGLVFAPRAMKIRAGTYADCEDAHLVVIAAGAAQKVGETRLDLLNQNAQILRSITRDVVASGFGGIFLVATNPVDVLTQVVLEESGFAKSRVIGSGCTLDSARLQFVMAQRLGVDSRDVHGLVLGEHGDSQFVAWSKMMIGAQTLAEVIEEQGLLSWSELEQISAQVRRAAYHIIQGKQATYYAIGMALVRITQAIFDDEHCILPISSFVADEYPQASGVCLSLPTKLCAQGVDKIQKIQLNGQELQQLEQSANRLRESFLSIGRTSGHL